MSWQPPRLSLQWGDYFKADVDEQSKLVAMVQQSLGGIGGKPLITLRTAVEKIAPVFGIDDIDAAIEALEEETADNEAKAMEAQHALAKLTQGEDGDQGGSGPAGGKNPPGAPGKRGGGGAPPPQKPGAAKTPPPKP